MSEGSLGLRTRSYGSLQPQPHNSDVLPIQSTSVPSLKPPKMLPFGSRDKEKIILQWICKLCGKRKVGMLLLFIASAAVFLSFMSVLNKGIIRRRFEAKWSENGAKRGKWSNGAIVGWRLSASFWRLALLHGDADGRLGASRCPTNREHGVMAPQTGA